MTQCPACSREVSDESRFCSSCGAALETPTSAPTETSLKGPPTATSRPSLDMARFIPGTVLAKRYRIVSLLGRGGMGEVYRADDLKLGQPVALKFLPERVARDEARLARFLNEVRVALRVTHPNVCRVYDVGEVEGPTAGSGPSSTPQGRSEHGGLHYIAMEYVDGEDLASLLRRIGRLPKDKAVQIARQLCSGLAAAHEEGILHRDLKPANVMIDGRGRAKITDFGLASLAGAIHGDEARAGTPLYMAPEQLAGREVTARSDIYALGLVLYELFTGKRAFDAATPAEMLRLEEESQPTSPSRHVEGMDSSVERAILRCLEREPASRPSSALAVAASLPGGDPLAAALAAGETPSPDLVAAAGPRGGLRLGVAATCLATIIVGLVWAALLGPRTLYGSVPLEKSVDVLEHDARAIATGFGYTEPPVDRASWFQWFPDEYSYLARDDRPNTSVTITDATQRMVTFQYRESPSPMVPRSLSGVVSVLDPPIVRLGEVRIWMDLRGRPLAFRGVPPEAGFSEGPPIEPDWPAVFEVAGLDITQFEETRPTLFPAACTEIRRAWNGTAPQWHGWPVRVEASACAGRITHFEHVVPWDSYWSAESFADEKAGQTSERAWIMRFLAALVVLLFTLIVGAVLLAMRNLRLGRGDRRGAMRLAIAVLVLRISDWLLSGHHVASLFEVQTAVYVLAGALSLAVLIWVLYVALEPYVRRFWPERIISWSRLIAGRLRDPLIGRDILIGFVFGVVSHGVLGLLRFLPSDVIPPVSEIRVFRALQGGRHVLGQLPHAVVDALFMSLGLLVLVLVIRVIVRRTSLAAGLCCLVVAGANAMQFASFAGPRGLGMAMLVGFAVTLVFIGTLVVVLLRFGLLAMVSMALCGDLLIFFPVTVDTTAPYFGAGLVGLVAALAVALYGFRITLGGQPLFKTADGAG